MKKVFILALIFIIGIVIDIVVEFKEEIIPKKVVIIKPIEKAQNKDTVKPLQKEQNVSKILTQDPKVIQLIREGNASIDLSKVSTVINKETQTEICSNELSIYRCMSNMNLTIGDAIFIRIFKLTAELEVWVKSDDYYQLLRVYSICKQSGFLGPKLKEGDQQGPEGFYSVTKSMLNPNSKYHLAFNLGFPNSYDKLHKRTGSALMIHGDCISVGCYAMGHANIEQIYELVEKALDAGQQEVQVHIFPFRMTEDIMLEYSNNEWYNFWGNLKEGYDYFEESGIPPKVSIVNRRYQFE